MLSTYQRYPRSHSTKRPLLPPSAHHHSCSRRFLILTTAAAMRSSSPHFPSLFLFLLLLLAVISPRGAAAAAGGSNGNVTVFELLPKFALPKGLLPDAVASYSLDEDGRFVVELGRPSCYVQFGSYLVYYDQRITGTLKIGSIRDLDGIEVQSLFFWLGVDEIKVDLPPSDYIYFQVGWISKRLSVGDFLEVHSCLDRTAYGDQIKGLFPKPLYEIEELITGDVHVTFQK